MYTNKKNVLQLVSLLKEHGIHQVVLCPGSRNIPLIQTFSNHLYFTCFQITDERSAAFYALGLALQSGRPTAVCCTSGTALLNMYPAVAEAYYQNVPLVVISADRPAAWIGQMDGQTLPQKNIFAPIIKYSIDLPEINKKEDEWFCNRLINEALLATDHHGKGPVHINVPISEPLFDFSTKELPKERVIKRYVGLNVYEKAYDTLIDALNTYSKKMMIAGQMNTIFLFEKRVSKQIYKHFTWMSEHIGNKTIPGMAIKNFDPLIYSLDEEEKEKMRPQLVITYGGHIVSKRMKNYLRKYPPVEHWHISKDGKVADLFGTVTNIIEVDPFEFIEKMAPMIDNKACEYPKIWEKKSKELAEPEFKYSEMAAIGKLIHTIPNESALHLANSSSVRYAQLFNLDSNVEVCCNRGTSGIEGSLSTALGYSFSSDKLNFITIGDMSFFYDMTAIAIKHIRNNVRILLLNNKGGEIFCSFNKNVFSTNSKQYIVGDHKLDAKSWSKQCGFTYLSAHNQEEMDEATLKLVDANSLSPILLEVFTDKDEDTQLLKDYYNNLKNK